MNNSEEILLEQSKDNLKVIKIKIGQKQLYLGSKYNETRNINSFVDKLNIEDGESFIFIFGTGSGEYIKCLLNNTGCNNKIFIFEPSKEIYNFVLERNCIKKILQKDERINIYYFNNKIDVLNILNRYIDKSYVNRYIMDGYTNYSKIFGEKFNILKQAVWEYWNELESLRISNIMFSDIVVENYIENLDEIEKGINVAELEGRFKDKTAVIVSSGPSLHKNIKVLSTYSDRCVIICAARSLGELLENNIMPDFICAIDPGDITYKLISKFFKLKIPLLTLEQVNYRALKKYGGIKIFSLNSIKNIVQNVFKEKYISLQQGGSVAHMAVSFSVLMGVKNIIFIGQDLAFTDNKYHSELSSNDSLIDEKESYGRNNLFYVAGNVQEKVLTNRIFLTFKNWIEVFIDNHNNINFINSTEGGAKIKGAEVLNLKDSLCKYCDSELNKQLNFNYKNRCKGKLKNYLLERLKSMKNISLKGIDYSEKMLEYYRENNSLNIKFILNKLDQIDDRFYKNEELIYILNLFSYRDMDKLSSEYREKVGETEVETGLRLALRSAAVYKLYNTYICKLIDKISGDLYEKEN